MYPLDDTTIKKIIQVVRLTAQIILENGGETYRAEDTIARICHAFRIYDVDAVAIPTGVFITISIPGSDNYTVIKRVKNRTIDLDKINTANTISRQLTAGTITLDQAITQLQGTLTIASTNKILPILASALSSGFFTLLFGGSLLDFSIAAVCGGIIQLLAFLFKGEEMFPFIISLVGGFTLALIAVLSTLLFPLANIDLIITGGIMPLLPGLAMTNAIRDTMRGDLVSGVARGTEALVVAIGLAVGVGLVLKTWLLLGGGLV